MTGLSPKMMTVSIVYDRSGNEYPAGETVGGHVVLEIQEQVTLGGVRIYFHGKGRVSWNSLANVNRAREIYLSEAQEILDSESSMFTSLNLRPGVYRYPFSLRLPVDLPASYKGSHGYVRYKARATVDGPWKAKQFCVESEFIVSRSVDLNREPAQLREPVEVRKELDLSGGCYGSGSAMAEFIINRRCFVAGEKILLNGNVEYLTNSRIRRTTVAIVQKITLHKSPKKHVLRRTVAKVDGPSAPPYERGHWSNVQLIVPSLPTSRLDGCSLIDIEYFIEIFVDLTLPFANVSKKLTSIVIGSIPLQSTTTQRPSLSRAASDTSTSSTQRLKLKSCLRKSNPQKESSGSWGTQWDMVRWMTPSTSDAEQNHSPPATEQTNIGRSSASSGDGLLSTSSPTQEPTIVEIHAEPKRIRNDDH